MKTYASFATQKSKIHSLKQISILSKKNLIIQVVGGEEEAEEEEGEEDEKN